jgi:hypothetical protein
MGSYTCPVHLTIIKIRQVPISVAMVIPLTGLLEEPIKPTIRDATVTKNAPNTITSNPNNNLLPIEVPGISELGISAITSTRTRLPIPTIFIDRSLSVLGTSMVVVLVPSFLSEPILPLKEDIIVGIVLIKVIKPPAATAPAPIWRI